MILKKKDRMKIVENKQNKLINRTIETLKKCEKIISILNLFFIIKLVEYILNP